MAGLQAAIVQERQLDGTVDRQRLAQQLSNPLLRGVGIGLVALQDRRLTRALPGQLLDGSETAVQ